METPRVMLSKAGNPTIGFDSPRRASSISATSDERRRSSTSQHPIVAAQALGSGDTRKPSVVVPYFQASARRVSQFNAPRFNTEVTEYLGSKAKAAADAKVLPTYKTEPDRRFVPHVVKRVMDSALEEALEGMEHYESAKCRALTTSVCEDIKQKVKFLNYDRYKLVCVVYFGSVKGQEMRVASRCLWNHNFDTFASSSVTKGDIFAVAMMYGIYKE